MELNLDCVRDVMIYLEDHLGIYKDEDNTQRFDYLAVTTSQLTKDTVLADYPPDVIVYTTLQLWRGGLILLENPPKIGEEFYCLNVIDITWEGHKFIGNIRSETIWTGIKKCAKQIGVFSTHGLQTIATTVITSICDDPALTERIKQIILS